ncbi:MAG: ABC-three component system protein [Planctomycetota bacterium]
MAQSPSKQIRNFSPDEWDEFVLEWMDGFDPQYAFTDRLDGAGDKGRDVVGYVGEPSSGCEWDNYQCKHYKDKLIPSEVWIELGKLCVFTFLGEFSVPRRYRFVAPKGVGTSLHDYLRNPEKLRKELRKQWKNKCENEISKKSAYPLEGDLLAHVNAFDFSIVGYVPVKDLIEQHARTKHHFKRFDIDPPVRPADESPPEDIRPEEVSYVTALLEAYGDCLARPVVDIADIENEGMIRRHFDRSRQWFYSADSLNRFSRDQVEVGTFEKLKKEILDGIIDTVEEECSDAFVRVRRTTDKAQTIIPSNSKLTGFVTPADKKGVCHHLVNDSEIAWRQGE